MAAKQRANATRRAAQKQKRGGENVDNGGCHSKMSLVTRDRMETRTDEMQRRGQTKQKKNNRQATLTTTHCHSYLPA